MGDGQSASPKMRGIEIIGVEIIASPKAESSTYKEASGGTLPYKAIFCGDMPKNLERSLTLTVTKWGCLVVAFLKLAMCQSKHGLVSHISGWPSIDFHREFNTHCL